MKDNVVRKSMIVSSCGETDEDIDQDHDGFTVLRYFVGSDCFSSVIYYKYETLVTFCKNSSRLIKLQIGFNTISFIIIMYQKLPNQFKRTEK